MVKNSTNNFKLKNFIFGVTSTTKNSDKQKWMCSDYGITFDSAGSWKFDNKFARNILIFDVDNRWSSDTNNRNSF